MSDSRYDERALGRLLAALPPVPEAWVVAAKGLPFARREIDRIVELAQADASYRERVLEDLEGALREQGVEPRPAAIAALQARLR